MDVIPLKPERKAQLEEYVRRRGQDHPPSRSMKLSPHTWNGNVRISKKRLKVFARAMKT